MDDVYTPQTEEEKSKALELVALEFEGVDDLEVQLPVKSHSLSVADVATRRQILKEWIDSLSQRESVSRTELHSAAMDFCQRFGFGRDAHRANKVVRIIDKVVG